MTDLLDLQDKLQDTSTAIIRLEDEMLRFPDSKAVLVQPELELSGAVDGDNGLCGIDSLSL